ncbi:MAG TPA: thiamine pyrophosphate-requiring protein [Solirubrobacteraceae bacterium]|jgi:pyruvate dehydrogenase (quinone)|nr:thiamine pyrophosphate-requiring protein [Solirubrobacteraceae bacterium]
MAETVGEYILRRLHEHGIGRIYGYPGDGINGLLGAFHEVGDEVEFVQCRHEEIAAFAATAHAKLTGEVGVCMATSGPGAIHLLNGLYDAKLDGQPVVAIVGQQKTTSLGTNYQQEVDLDALFKDVASEFVQTCMSPSQARHLVDRAVRVARTSRTVTCIVVPEDVQESEYEDPPRAHGSVFSSVSDPQPPTVVPAEAELARAAEVLNAGQRVAMLIGRGAAHAPDEVVEVADLLGAGVAKALNGRDALPDDLPFVTGPIGLLGSKPSYDMTSGCDTLLMVGTSFPYAEWLPEPGQARGVQIDLDGRRLGIRYPTEVNLIGDARDTLRALIPHLVRKEDRAWREQLEEEVDRWWRILADRAMDDADPLNPQRVFHELSPRLPERCILTADSGSATNWWARHLRLRKGMKAALSGTLATMCPGVPYAFAAKLAYPDRPVIASLGDGAMQMLGNTALLDIAARWEEWPNKQLVVLVLNNRDLNQVTWEQRVLAGDPKLDASQALPDFPYARYAELLGLKGIRVDDPDDVGDAWDEALAADRPVVYEAITDPEVPPLPPHIKMDQAKKMAQALVGDPARGRIMRQSAKGKLKEIVNR